MEKKKYVMIETISMFKIKYCVELPDEMPEGCTPYTWGADTVVANEAKEFSQRYLDEVISDYTVLTEEEALAQFREEEPNFAIWGDELIKTNHFTKVDTDDS